MMIDVEDETEIADATAAKEEINKKHSKSGKRNPSPKRESVDDDKVKETFSRHIRSRNNPK